MTHFLHQGSTSRLICLKTSPPARDHVFKYMSLSEHVRTQSTVLGMLCSPRNIFVTFSRSLIYVLQTKTKLQFLSIFFFFTDCIYWVLQEADAERSGKAKGVKGYDLWTMSEPESRTEKLRLRLHRIGKGLGQPIEGVQRLIIGAIL